MSRSPSTKQYLIPTMDMRLIMDSYSWLTETCGFRFRSLKDICDASKERVKSGKEADMCLASGGYVEEPIERRASVIRMSTVTSTTGLRDIHTEEWPCCFLGVVLLLTCV